MGRIQMTFEEFVDYAFIHELDDKAEWNEPLHRRLWVALYTVREDLARILPKELDVFNYPDKVMDFKSWVKDHWDDQ
jgi:hypothetical protein